MTSDTLPTTHPVTRCCAQVRAAVDEAAGSDPIFLSTQAKGDALVELGHTIDRLTALRLQVMAASGDVAAEDGCRNVAAWLTPRTLTDYGANAAAERFAEDLDQRWQQVGAALAGGRINLAQAQVIIRALNALGSEVDRPTLSKAETVLVDKARTFGPRHLRVLGDKVLEMVAPDVHEDEERKKLQAAQRRANAATRLRMHHRGDGSTDISARIPEAAASRLKTMLDSFTSPRHDAHKRSTHGPGTHGPGGNGPGSNGPGSNGPGSNGPGSNGLLDPATGRRLPQDRVLGEAFCSLLECIDPTRTPLHGGDATTVVVTIDYDSLKTDTGVGVLADGTRITAGETRRLACNAGILPAVLGGKSEVLDLGRARRLYSSAQRRAMALEHPTCRTEGCTIPATWCEGHHFSQKWVDGGRTDLKDGKLLCPWHHHRAHDPGYTTQLLTSGNIRFHRRH